MVIEITSLVNLIRYKTNQNNQQISQLKEAFPEKVRSVQKALAEREIMHAEAKSLHHLKEVGLLTEKAWAESHEKIIRRKRVLQDKLLTGT